MNSTKITIVMTAFGVLGGLLASVFRLDIITYFIDTSLAYNVMRLMILVLLVGLLFAKPPRSPEMRAGIALIGISLHVWAMETLFGFGTTVLDSLIFMSVGIALEVEALEPRTALAPAPLRRMPA